MSMSITPQNNRDLNLVVLCLWSKFGDPTLNGSRVIARTSKWLTHRLTHTHTHTDTHTHRRRQRQYPKAKTGLGWKWPPFRRRYFQMHLILKAGSGKWEKQTEKQYNKSNRRISSGIFLNGDILLSGILITITLLQEMLCYLYERWRIGLYGMISLDGTLFTDYIVQGQMLLR